MYRKASTLDDLTRAAFQSLLKSKNVVVASRGKNREILGVLLRLTNPRARLSHTDKKGKIFSGLGELFWYLAKTDDVEQIAYYIPAYRGDAEGGRIIGAYGPRIFAMREKHDQWDNVAALLKVRNSSRKAVIQLLNAEDVASRKKEIPCTCDFQFMIRAERLHMVAHMRSNDAFLGLPHDVFAFTMMQEMMACKLGIEVGEYVHMVGSLHLYEENEDHARQYIDEGWQSTVTAAMPPMPMGDQQAAVDAVVKAERMIRKGQMVDLPALELSSYWADLVRLLQIFRQQKNGNKKEIDSIRKAMSTRTYDAYIAKAARRSQAHEP
jgi:thymidylate synthase